MTKVFNSQTEIKELREEIAKLRERVAMLEARHVTFIAPPATGAPTIPNWPNPPYTITCGGPAK
jgi:hypothetical protein